MKLIVAFTVLCLAVANCDLYQFANIAKFSTVAPAFTISWSNFQDAPTPPSAPEKRGSMGSSSSFSSLVQSGRSFAIGLDECFVNDVAAFAKGETAEVVGTFKIGFVASTGFSENGVVYKVNVNTSEIAQFTVEPDSSEEYTQLKVEYLRHDRNGDLQIIAHETGVIVGMYPSGGSSLGFVDPFSPTGFSVAPGGIRLNSLKDHRMLKGRIDAGTAAMVRDALAGIGGRRKIEVTTPCDRALPVVSAETGLPGKRDTYSCYEGEPLDPELDGWICCVNGFKLRSACNSYSMSTYGRAAGYDEYIECCYNTGIDLHICPEDPNRPPRMD